MANENQNENQEIPQPLSVESTSKSKFNPKVIIIGLPLFIIQLIAVYFVTANILMKKMDSRTDISTNTIIDKVTEQDRQAEEEHASNNNHHYSSGSVGEHLFELEDMIINPANTAGNTLLLSSIAFDVPDEASAQELEKKEIIVKDMVISIMSSKTLAQLSSSTYRDTIRTEISDQVQDMLGDVRINRVYFSKYILN